MSEPRKILILLHASDSLFDEAGYLISFLRDEWEAIGFITELVRGINREVSGDIVIPHLDLTLTPREYRDYFLAYPNVVNRELWDISKSRISANMVARGDGYAGAVIVKTDRNYGGLPERHLSDDSLNPDDGDFSWKEVQYLDRGEYPVFSSLDEVPEGVFANSNLVVEKFLPEILQGEYCLRYYYFLGSAGINLLFRSKHQTEKGNTAQSVEEVEIPEELYAMREELGADYGKFDYVLRDGKVNLFDVNRTPATSTLGHWGLTEKVARQLAPGITSLLPASPDGT